MVSGRRWSQRKVYQKRKRVEAQFMPCDWEVEMDGASVLASQVSADIKRVKENERTGSLVLIRPEGCVDDFPISIPIPLPVALGAAVPFGTQVPHIFTEGCTEGEDDGVEMWHMGNYVFKTVFSLLSQIYCEELVFEERELVNDLFSPCGRICRKAHQWPAYVVVLASHQHTRSTFPVFQVFPRHLPQSVDQTAVVSRASYGGVFLVLEMCCMGR